MVERWWCCDRAVRPRIAEVGGAGGGYGRPTRRRMTAPTRGRGLPFRVSAATNI